MKKIRIRFLPLLVLALVLGLGMPAGSNLPLSSSLPVYAAEGNLLEDAGDLLTDEEEAELYDKLESVSDKRDSDIAVITASDLQGLTAVEYVDDYIDTMIGVERSHGAVALLIYIDGADPSQREVRIGTDETANKYFSDDENNGILDAIVDDLSAGNYASACNTYADECDRIYGLSLDEKQESKGFNPLGILGGLGIGGIAGFLMGTFQKSKLKTRKRKSGAAEYKAEGGIKFSVKKDKYLRTHVERRKIEKDHDEPDHEAGTTHTTSSGSKHGGAGRGF